jgi:simple sugar transport system substrate-binding protein
MKRVLSIFIILCVFITLGCFKKPSDARKDLSVLVFITGLVAGSPTYELMTEGALEFEQANPNVSVKIYEAGFNQAEWEQQLAEMISDGEYDIVLGSNPSLPLLCENVGKMFPEQKFIITDAQYEGNPQIRTYLYNQYEQSFFLGYLAGLVTTSDMTYANARKRIGFIAAQEYPLLTKQMIPGFLDGARIADPQIELDRRIIGSWADAGKAAELASSMMDNGVDVLTIIAGSAASGIIRPLSEKGAYLVNYNINEYNMIPGLVVGCGMLEQKKLVKEILSGALSGGIEYGISQTVGLKEGYINFIFEDPAYIENLPADIRHKFEGFMYDILSGKINYTVPEM